MCFAHVREFPVESKVKMKVNYNINQYTSTYVQIQIINISKCEEKKNVLSINPKTTILSSLVSEF